VLQHSSDQAHQSRALVRRQEGIEMRSVIGIVVTIVVIYVILRLLGIL
jgi:hypothetical protein